MAIGTAQSVQTLNMLLVRYVTQMNDLANNIAQLQDYVTAVGADGLQALPSPFTSDDATSYVTAVSYLNTIAQVWLGTVAQPSTYNFQDQMASLVGPTPT
jgi:hypothetical protein